MDAKGCCAYTLLETTVRIRRGICFARNVCNATVSHNIVGRTICNDQVPYNTEELCYNLFFIKENASGAVLGDYTDSALLCNSLSYSKMLIAAAETRDCPVTAHLSCGRGVFNKC